MSTAAALHQLGLDAKLITALKRKAKDRGKSTPQYVRAVLKADLLADRSFDELLAPVRERFRRSGISEIDLDALVTRARKRAPAPKR